MTLDELLAAVAAELRPLGHYVAPASLATDEERAAALFAAGDALHVGGRRMLLRFATRFLGRGFEARAVGNVEESERWAERAESELDLYRAPDGNDRIAVLGGVL